MNFVSYSFLCSLLGFFLNPPSNILLDCLAFSCSSGIALRSLCGLHFGEFGSHKVLVLGNAILCGYSSLLLARRRCFHASLALVELYGDLCSSHRCLAFGCGRGRRARSGRRHGRVGCRAVFDGARNGLAPHEEAIEAAAVDALCADLAERALWRMLALPSPPGEDMAVYLLARSDALQALVECAHPPLVVGRVCGLLLAQAQLILLVGNEQRLLEPSAGRVERVARPLPALVAQVSFGVHGGSAA